MRDHASPVEQTAQVGEPEEDAGLESDTADLDPERRRAAGHLVAWWRRRRSQLHPDPRRWTALGWANAIYIVLLVGLLVQAPRENDGSSLTFQLGLIVLIPSRSGFEWWFKRRDRVNSAPDR